MLFVSASVGASKFGAGLKVSSPLVLLMAKAA
jgi:hypothetical protein